MRRRNPPPARDVLVFQAACASGAILALVASQWVASNWRSALLVMGFGAGMAVAKLLQAQNELARGIGWAHLLIACLLVAGACFLFEQPHLVGLSQTGVVVCVAVLTLPLLAIGVWRARRALREREDHGPD